MWLATKAIRLGAPSELEDGLIIKRAALNGLMVTAIFAAGGCSVGAERTVPALSMPQTAASQATRAPKFKSLYSFKGGSTDGTTPGGLTVLNGLIYGTTAAGGGGYNAGTVFSITASGAEQKLYSFTGRPNDGLNPGPASLIALNGVLYGTTVVGGNGTCRNGAGFLIGCGIVYSITTSGQETVLYNFQGGQDGAFPGGLTAVNGVLYGTTQQGGSNRCGGAGCGTVFSLTTSSKEKILYSFQDLSDGAYPSALMHVKAKLYGSTIIGGGYCYSNGQGCGTLFSLTTSGKEKTLYAFPGGGNGSGPEGKFVDLKGTLYGATSSGGGIYCYDSLEGGCGTVYSITTSGQEQVLHRFTGVYVDGALPYSGVIAWKGVLYGVTYEGGGARVNGACDNGHFMSVGCGTVFSITTSGQEGVLYSFSGTADGGFPNGSLVVVNRSLYGTTTTGGTNNIGTVFKLTP